MAVPGKFAQVDVKAGNVSMTEIDLGSFSSGIYFVKVGKESWSFVKE